MAITSKHPVSAPPVAPPRETTGHLVLRGWCTLLVFSALAAPGWLLALGDAGTAILVVASIVISAVVWLRTRPALQWRRLPWLAFAFVAWAALPVAWADDRGSAAVVWALLAVATFQGLFIAVSLTWRDIVRTIASALKWVIGVSLVFELGVAVLVGGPVGPGLSPAASDAGPVWSTGGFFGGSPLQGIVGDPGLLGSLMVLAIVVFTIRHLAGAPRRSVLLVWIAVAAFVLIRSGSVASFVAVAGVTLVLTTVLLMRTASRAGERTRFYVLYAAAGAAAGAVVWLAFGDELGAVEGTWRQVWAHFGPIGVILLTAALLAFVWRSWFFAVDRPRFDLRADRPYSPLSLLPTLLAALLLVESVAEPGLHLLWGWMLVVLLAAKIKQAPLVGVGPAEESMAIERGELPRTSR